MDNSRHRVLGYVRVSTTEQADSGLGLAAQEATIRSECERRGWELLDVVADEGSSGKSLDRLGLHATLTRIAAGGGRRARSRQVGPHQPLGARLRRSP